MSDPSIMLNLQLRYLLRPLAKILLHFGMSYGEFSDAAKSAFVNAAQSDSSIPKQKQTTSRISTITGLSRKVVHAILNQRKTEKIESLHKLNRAARVINGWINDPQFLNTDGNPITLKMDSENPNFSQLVKKYSGDITARTIADELVRIGAVKTNDEGKLTLIKKAYLPNNDKLEQIKLICQSSAEFFETIEYNIHQSDIDKKRFQRKVYYNNIPFESGAELKHKIEEIAQTCLEDINKILKQHDRDNSNITGTKQYKIGLGMHYIEEEIK